MDVDFMDYLKRRVSLVQEVSKHVPLKKKGHLFWGCCPFHQERTPSFCVNEDRGTYHCFGCSAHGDVVSFLQKVRNLSFLEALQALGEAYGVPIPEKKSSPKAGSVSQWMEEICQWFQKRLASACGEAARDYLARREILPQEIQDFRLGWAPGGAAYYHAFLKDFSHVPWKVWQDCGLVKGESPDRGYFFFKDRIIFPIPSFMGKSIVGFGGRCLDQRQPKYLNSPEGPLFSKKLNLYGSPSRFTHKGGEQKTCLLVEGYLDVIGASRHYPAWGILGTSFSHEQCQRLIRRFSHVTLCFDGDEAGSRASQRAVEIFLSHMTPQHTVRVAKLPQGEDPYSLSLSDPDTFCRLIQGSLPIFQAVIESLKTRFPPSGPENQARWEQESQRLLGLLADPALKRAYRNYLFQEQRAFFRYGKAPSAPSPRGAPPCKAVDIRLMLGVLMQRPGLIHRFMNFLTTLSFPLGSRESQALEEMLAWAGQSDLDFCEYLMGRGKESLWQWFALFPLVVSSLESLGPQESEDGFFEVLIENYSFQKEGLPKGEPGQTLEERWAKIQGARKAYLEKIYGSS